MAKKSTQLEALHNTFEENSISPESIELNDALIMEIKKNADSVPDYRHQSYTKHLLGDIIMIVFFAILGNANEWGEIESFAKKKETWLRKYQYRPFFPCHRRIAAAYSGWKSELWFGKEEQCLR